MQHLEHISLRPYDSPLDPAVFDVTPSGLDVIRRRDPDTGQSITLIGSPHPEYDPERREFTDIEREWEHFNAGLDTKDDRIVINEGRTPILQLNGEVQAGERPPVIDAHDRQAVIRMHGEMGLITRMARLSCASVVSGEVPNADRVIALQLEKAGYSRLHIMQYYLYRQVPQWARGDRGAYPNLADYLQEDVINRYCNALQNAWPEHEFSLGRILNMSPPLLAATQHRMNEDEVEYFLTQSVGIMYGKADPNNLSPVQKVAKAYNRVRTRNFAHVLKKDWETDPHVHKFAVFGRSHVRAISGEMAKLGIAVLTGK